MPGYAFVQALLNGKHEGRLYVDDPEDPGIFVAALACGFNYIAGRSDRTHRNQLTARFVAAELAPEDDYIILFPTSPSWETTLPTMFADATELIRAGRLEYEFDPERFRQQCGTWRAQLPRGFTVRPYDRHLAQEHNLETFWGSIDTFLAHGFGYAVMHQDQPVSRCHTVLIGNDHAEISVETLEAHRRQGLATFSACAFIERCLVSGLTPAWSCWDHNIPSQRLAEKLGFSHTATTVAYVINPS